MTLTIQYIDAARNAWCNEEAMADESNIPPKKYSGLRDYVKAEQMVQLALAIPLGCVIGWFFGGLLDRYFHTGWNRHRRHCGRRRRRLSADRHHRRALS